MSFTIRRLVCAAVLLLAANRVVLAQDAITITGTVTTRADGLSVPGAQVTVVGGRCRRHHRRERPLHAEGAAVTGARRSAAGEGRGARPAGQSRPTWWSNGPALTVDVALSLGFTEQVTVGSRARRRRGREGGAGRRHHAATRSRRAATRKRRRSSSRWRRRSTSRGRRSPTAPTRCGRRRCGASDPIRCWCSINGKRRHQSALVHLNGSIGRGSTGVDLNAIPVSAIDHIEVLRDGAAAQYGSDAIAGVINIVLKGGVSRPDVTSKFGLSTGSFAGNSCTPNGLTCTEGRRHRLLRRRAVRSRRLVGRCRSARAASRVAAEYRHHNRTNRASFDPRDQIVAGDAGNNAGAPSRITAGAIPTPATSMTFVNASVPLNGAADALPLRASAATAAATPNSAGFYRRALDARNWPQIYPLGFLPDDPADGGRRVGRGRRARRRRPVELRRRAANTATTASRSRSATR